MKNQSLTSRQQFTVLDELLVLALEPIRLETDVFYSWVAEVVHHALRSRRKNASDLTQAGALVLTNAPDAVRELLAGGLDRGHAFSLLERVHALGAQLRRVDALLAAREGDATALLLREQRIRRLLGDSPRLVPALTESRYWHEEAVRWRNGIVDKYGRLLYAGAQRMHYGSGGRIELEPTHHDSWITATDSVNRFRSDQATLAGYLQNSLRGTYRVAASNSLGLAAPGARVNSEDALQTTTYESAERPDVDLARDPYEDDASSLLRAVALVGRDPDVRAALLLSDASPVEALAALGEGPLGKRGDVNVAHTKKELVRARI